MIVRIKPAKQVKVPSVTGKNFISVYNQIVRKELKPELKFYDVKDIDDGVVLSQYPEAGRVVSVGSRLKIVVSRNDLGIEVPSLIGSDLTMAKNKLNNLHIRDKSVSLGIGVITYAPSDSASDEIILKQNPKPGEKVKPDTKVNLLVAVNSEEGNFKMPDLEGQSVDNCYDLLLSKGLSVKQEIVETKNIKMNGIISSQSISKGTQIKDGDQLTITVQYYEMENHFYRGYEKLKFSIPKNEEKAKYEILISDDESDRIRYSQINKAGDEFEIIFLRTGNARVTLLKNKVELKKMTIKVDSFD